MKPPPPLPSSPLPQHPRPPAPRWASALAASAALVSPALAQSSWLDRVDDALSLQNADGSIRADLSGLLDLEGYYIDQLPPGLIFSNDDGFFNPRLSLYLDLQLGAHFYSLTQVRFDRGFDPGAVPDGDARFDEYLLRWTPWLDGRLNVQGGKFATVFGEWVNRHDSWQNPFINAPLPYEAMVNMTDQTVPAGPVGFVNRKYNADPKARWLPVVWGPAYTTGASVFGLVQGFDYSVEFKNASVSSRPFVWSAADQDWSAPTVSARLGYRPNAAWKVGTSLSYGAYLQEVAEPALPAGTEANDFPQATVGMDVSYAWHRWQVWGEAIASRFDVPNVGHADVLGYFLETKYKFNPHLFGALRWNQQVYSEIDLPGSGGQGWDHDIWRAEVALGWRLDRHLQAKIQYGYTHQRGPQQQGEQLAAAQVTLKF